MDFDAGIPMSRASVTEGPPSLDQDTLWQMNLRSMEAIESGGYPVREGEPDCSYYIRTGLCRYGTTCRFNHPPNRKLAIATARMRGEYPERMGQPECQYYLKTGTCKFGATCKFHHPRDKAGSAGRVTLNILGYPLRPNEIDCAYYLRTGHCKFGSTCKFHHPPPTNMMVSVRGSPVYPPVQSPTNPGQLSYPRASFIPSPRWQGPSSYAPMLLPQGVVSVPGWNAYTGQLGSGSSSENQQQTSGNGQTLGTSRQSEVANVGSQGTYSSYPSASLPMGYYALQRETVFPERPGQPECQFYMKTGDCKFGAVCKFHHPSERIIPAPDCILSPIGLPLRPGEPLCIFYSRYGICKFGPSCKFDHPMGVFGYNVPSSSTDVPAVRRLLASSSSGSATLALASEIAAWHGWATLELKQGNIKKARNLLGKGLKYCGGNEYIYQSLALLEAKAKRYEQARYLFRQATKCNPKSCASWLAWAQLEARQENNNTARELFEKAVQASPKNRFAWHVWGVFESNLGYIDLGRKLLKIGHAVNPRDPVLLQSLGLLEYKFSTANLARTLFRKASELDPKHQPVWIAWGWMEWKEGNLTTARELYQRALSIDSTSESAARCLQAWGVLEQRVGNLSAARRLFRSSLNINSQSYITWMTWASLEEDQGNSVRAEEIRNLYFQQRTEVVDDASWIMGFLDIIDPAIDSIKKLLNIDQVMESSGSRLGASNGVNEEPVFSTPYGIKVNGPEYESSFDLDKFVREKLSLDPTKLDIQLETFLKSTTRISKSARKVIQSRTSL